MRFFFFSQKSVNLLVIVKVLHNYAIFRVVVGEQYVPKSPHQQVVFKFSDRGWRGGLTMVVLGDQTKKLPFNSACTNIYNFEQPSLHLLASVVPIIGLPNTMNFLVETKWINMSNCSWCISADEYCFFPALCFDSGGCCLIHNSMSQPYWITSITVLPLPLWQYRPQHEEMSDHGGITGTLSRGEATCYVNMLIINILNMLQCWSDVLLSIKGCC